MLMEEQGTGSGLLANRASRGWFVPLGLPDQGLLAKLQASGVKSAARAAFDGDAGQACLHAEPLQPGDKIDGWAGAVVMALGRSRRPRDRQC